MNLSLVNRNILTLLLIFFISALFRLTNLDLIEYKADEAINLYLASRPIFGHEFAPTGTVSSIGIANFPLLNYILFPLTLITLNPMEISFAIGLLNTISIVVFYLIIKKYYNFFIALSSSLLIATSPWHILLSRKIWAQDFIFPLSIPLILSFHKIVFEKNQKYWIMYGLFSALLIQIHQSALFFIVPLTFFMFILKNKLNVKFLLLGIIIGLIPTIHYVFYQISTGCFDCRMFLSSSERVTNRSILLHLLRPFQLLNQGNFYLLLKEDVIYFAQNYPFAYYLKKIFYIEYFLIPLGVFVSYRFFKKTISLILSVLMLPLIYAFLKLDPHIHYFIIISPFLFLFLGIAFNYLFKNKIKAIKYSSALSFIVIILYSIYYNYAFYQTINDVKTIKGDYGTIYKLKHEHTKKIYSDFINGPKYKEIIIASDIPYSLSRGSIGISRMIYNREETKNRIEILEERLKKYPLDPLAHQELVAFYTKEVPTKEAVIMLRARSKVIPGMEPVYKEAREYYNENNQEKPI